jgi:hypothetical protein
MDQKANGVETRLGRGSSWRGSRISRPPACSGAEATHFLNEGFLMYRSVILAGFLGLLLSQAGLAQTRLPRNNPVEQQVIESNRSVQRQQRGLADQQQNQFEINQLRQDLSRERIFPPPSIGRICAPGQIGC